MRIYNIKINGGIALKIILILLSLFMLIVFLFSIYKIFFTSGKFFVKDKETKEEIKEIKSDEYTNILQAVHDDIDSYIGIKIKFIGYVYRVLDFEENQFVLGRDMIINNEKNQSVVVGFLCESKNIKEYENDEWVEIEGEITKGKYHNSEIPIIKINKIQKADMPENAFVLPPNSGYIPTSGIL